MNARGKHVDKTYLSIDNATERGFLHRDYIAHCLRWSHVIKRLGQSKSYADARILDVGCGRELPLAKTLYSSRYIVAEYFGVDVGPIEDSAIAVFDSGKFPIIAWERTDILNVPNSALGDGHSNWLTCFEVLEHVEPEHMLKMLAKFRQVTTDDCRYFISTPCWNWVDCAANHVNEMTYEALGAVFEANGFVVENVYGTFASIRDYEHLLGDISLHTEVNGERLKIGKGTRTLHSVFKQLREYYDSNFLSCVFAPLFPAQSRNCLWELRKNWGEHAPKKKFPRLGDCEKPWGSSEHWEDMHP